MHRKKNEDITPIDGSPKPPRSGLKGLLRNEFTLSSNRTWQVSDLYNVRLSPLPIALQYTGALMSMVYLVFGALLFSSLLFLGVGDSIELVLRLMTSATISRIVLQFEIGGMIKVVPKRVYSVIVQVFEEVKFE